MFIGEIDLNIFIGFKIDLKKTVALDIFLPNSKIDNEDSINNPTFEERRCPMNLASETLVRIIHVTVLALVISYLLMIERKNIPPN